MEFDDFLLDNKAKFESKKKKLYGKLNVFLSDNIYFCENQIPNYYPPKKNVIRKKMLSLNFRQNWPKFGLNDSIIM